MKPATNAPAYAVLYPSLCEVARGLGYALALHGTLTRDADIIAIPWTDEAAPALELIKALKASLGAVTHTDEVDDLFPDCHPKTKPQGRVAYSLHLTNRGCEGPYFDVSVMPRLCDFPGYDLGGGKVSFEASVMEVLRSAGMALGPGRVWIVEGLDRTFPGCAVDAARSAGRILTLTGDTSRAETLFEAAEKLLKMRNL